MEKNFFDSSEVVNLLDQEIRFAFAIEGSLDLSFKNDTQYVKYIARLVGMQENEPFEIITPFHICTDEDYAQFATPTSDAIGLVDFFKESSGMYCPDWDQLGDIMNIQSIITDVNYSRWEFIIVPCNYVH